MADTALKLKLLYISDIDGSILVDWLDINSNCELESTFRGENREQFLDEMNVNNLSDLEGRIFKVRSYLDKNNKILIRPSHIREIKESNDLCVLQQGIMPGTPKYNGHLGVLTTKYQKIIEATKEFIEYLENHKFLNQEFIKEIDILKRLV